MIALAALLVAPVQDPTVVDPAWTLIRRTPISALSGAQISPGDGLLYAGRRASGVYGLYRIRPDDVLERVASANASYLAVVVDPSDGDIFVSERNGGDIFRTAFGTTGRTTWVSNLHAGDDDPTGMAIAPSNYGGPVIQPGEALVVDHGIGGPDGVFAWAPDNAGVGTEVVSNSSALVDGVDVAISPSAIFVADRGPNGAGSVFELQQGGILVPIPVAASWTPSGVVSDPITSNLFVTDVAAQRLVRVDPGTGALSDVVTGFGGLEDAAVDTSPDGRILVVGDPGSNAIYSFGRCSSFDPATEDCNSNGVWDRCDVRLGTSPDCNGNGVPDECDILAGTSSDCDDDGVPDECSACPTVEFVVLMDTSSSLADEGSALCVSIASVIDTLSTSGVRVVPELLTMNTPQQTCGVFPCLSESLVDRYGTLIPGVPPGPLQEFGGCAGSPFNACEDWGRAVAVVAGVKSWGANTVRLIVPIADEGPFCGNPVDVNDDDSIQQAIAVAQANGVVVSPIMGNGTPADAVALALQLANATGGQQFTSTDPAMDISTFVSSIVTNACAQVTDDCNRNGVPDDCDISAGTSLDLNGNGVPDECETAGTSFCVPAVPNSTGAPASISALGSTTVSDDAFALATSGLPAGQFGYFLTSQTQGMAMPMNSQGIICLSGNIGRFNNPSQIIQGPTGSIQVDLTSLPINPPTAVQPGDTWNFQCWYRDSNPGPTSNFTDAVSVTFQ